MKRKVLLAATAAAALATAPAVRADEQSSEPHKQPPQPRPQLQHPNGQLPGQHPGPLGQNRQGWTGSQGQVSAPYPSGHPAQGQGRGLAGWTGQGQPKGQPQGQARPGWRQGQTQSWPAWSQQPGARRALQSGRWNMQAEHRFDRRVDAAGWTDTRHDWRDYHRDWDHDARWRRDHDWWRGRPEFHLYVGVREGFWFAPGYGYYRVPEAYWDRHWDTGDYLPAFLWEYQIADWWDYDLPPPPYGCAWVWIDDGVALIDLSDGYVLEVQYGLW